MENTPNVALLVMDMQSAILGNLPDPSSVINNAAKALAHARRNQIPVIYVTVGFRQGMPEVGPNNKSFNASRERFSKLSPEEFLKIHPEVSPQGDEVTVVKRRFSAFTGSDLEVVLRAKSIQHLVLAGVSTSGVMLSTVREAADKDYRLTVLSDACADADEEVHHVLITKVFPRQANVMTVNEWTK